MVPIVREAVVARLSATTCIETWDYADALALEEVKAHAIDTVLDHFTELLEADTLSKLDKNRQRMVIAAAEKRSPPLLWELAQQGQLAALIWSTPKQSHIAACSATRVAPPHLPLHFPRPDISCRLLDRDYAIDTPNIVSGPDLPLEHGHVPVLRFLAASTACSTACTI